MTDRLTTVETERAIIYHEGFRAFVRRAWQYVCTDRFIPSWHIDEIAELLEDVARDRYRRVGREVSISVPPASSKSLVCSVLWQPWVWTWWPESRWITATYEGGPGSLALFHSRLSRDLVRSEWYQARWPLALPGDAESSWRNDKGGSREAVGTGGAITGKHAHFHVGDDLVPEQLSRIGTNAGIAKALDKARSYWWGTLSTREVEPGSTARVLIGQRLHRDDPPGEAARRGYEVVCFPAHFDPARRDPRDNRTQEGELLCPARAGEDYYRERADDLGPAAASAQLEQLPIPPGGTLIPAAYLSRRYDMLPPALQRTMQAGRADDGEQRWVSSWDLAFKGKSTSDWVVGQVWCAYRGAYYLVDQVRAQAGFRASKQMVRDLTAAYPWVRTHLVEDAANASALEDDLRAEIPGIVLEPHGGGCLARIQQVEGVFASGAVAIPERAPWLGGGNGYVTEHLAYDGLGTHHDDQVAATGLALVHLSGRRAGAAMLRAMEQIRSDLWV